MKKCSRCQENRPVEKFSKSKRQKDGLNRYCKPCASDYSKGRRAKINETRKQSYSENEEFREKRKDESLRSYSKRRDQMGTRHSRSKSNAKERNLEFLLTIEEYAELMTELCCYCEGELPKYSGGLDRVDCSKPYTKENVVPCCKWCNIFRKNFVSPTELKILVDQLAIMRGVPRNKVWSTPESFPNEVPFASETT